MWWRMKVLLLTIELRLPAARSLKDKRAVIKSLLSRIRRQYNVSACEADYHQAHGRSQLAVAWVGRDGDTGRRLLDRIELLVEETNGAVVAETDVELR